ncbi:BTAD domain-containing putative transcriptional regulator [Spongisporangium articulatum]|uniref:BTAD domain-containing putative transcriptional regulator n=1 Tax=Spongisporangium articulatum TaxID=3362603 RepID=A0ABW8AI70_9ACTN
MQVAILGPLAVENAGRPVVLGGARLRALLVRLAADPGGWVPVSALVDALWPEEPPTDEVNALQSLVSRLRRALPSAALVESGPAGYRLAVTGDDVDAARFEAQLGAARRAPGGIDGAGVRAALALWRGPALVDVPDLPFATAWAARLEELRLGAVEDAVEAALTGGLDLQAADVVLELEEVVAAHPLRERPHGQLIRVLAATGRQAEALAVYDRLRTRLADELGVDPAPELQALHLALLRGEPLPGAVVSAPPVPKPLRRTNLRPALTSFVGREDDVRQVRELLRRARLVTLIGPGGSGKTRLSVEAAAGLTERGTEGVWQVQFAPVTDPADLPAATLTAIGMRDAVVDRGTKQPTYRDPTERLVEAIDGADVVLLFDNCEHVIDAAAALAETLLGSCPELSVIATSREPLGIGGESLWPVNPLPSQVVPDEQLPAALELFVDRAALVRPGFTLDASNTPVVAEICRRLDGLPLAIELAAARLRTLPVETIEQRLSDRFRLLTGGSRTALPRHQTLRAVVAWSWDLLTEPERLLAERLSIYPGGVSVEAAEAQPVDPDGPSTPELLDTLADKSLLVVVEPGAGSLAGPRYRMLETIREFGTERLAERGEIASTRAAFVRYFIDLVEEAEPQLRTGEQLSAMARLDLERDNILAALRYATDAGDGPSAVRLGAGMGWYWTLLGQHEEAALWLGPAVALPGEEPFEQYLVARMIYHLSAGAVAGELPDASVIAQIGALAERVDTARSHPLLTLVKPALAVLTDDDEGTRKAIRENLEHPDPWARAMLHQFSAINAENFGDIDGLRVVLPQALEGFRSIGDRWGLATALGTLANLQQLDGQDAAALASLEEARALMRELRARDDEAFTLTRASALRARGGDLAGARALADRAMELAGEGGSQHAEAGALMAYGNIARLEGDLVGARAHLERARVVLAQTKMSPPQIGAMLDAALIRLDLLEGDQKSARRRVPAVLEAVEEGHDMPVAGMVGDVLAWVARDMGDDVLAARMLGAATSIRGAQDLGEPDTLTLVAALKESLGETAYAQARASGEALTRAQALELFGSVAPQ